MIKKHPNHNVPNDKHRTRSLKHSFREKIKVAQQSSLRQRPSAPITLAPTPWASLDNKLEVRPVDERSAPL